MPQSPERITFAGSTAARLTGLLHLPEESAIGSILLAHCFTCGKDVHTMSRLARGLASSGYAVLRFDFTGLGESEGSFEDTTVTTNVKDLVRAATTLIERGYGPCGMVGHSLGGAAAVLAAHRIRTVRSVAVLAAPANAGHVRHLITDEDQQSISLEGCQIVDIGGRPFPISDEFLTDLEAHDDLDVGHLDRPLLVLHGVNDDVVEVQEGERIFAAASQPKAFVPLLDTDHLVTSRQKSEEVLDHLRWWFAATL